MPVPVMHEGVARLSDYHLSSKVSNIIKEISRLNSLSTTQQITLEKEIEQAIKWALTLQKMPQPDRSEIKKAIEKTVALSKKLTKALNNLPPQSNSFFLNSGSSLTKQINHATLIELDCDAAARSAKTKLAGAGETPKADIQCYLCRDIAVALNNAGIKLSTSRPKTVDNAGGLYWQLTKVCFDELKVTISELKPYLKKGKELANL